MKLDDRHVMKVCHESMLYFSLSLNSLTIEFV